MKLRETAPPILNMLKICEIFKSIQGESTRAGMPCAFVRLSGCNLSCTYCDTPYAFEGGTDFTIEDIIKKVKNFGCSLVEITGGEPLLQAETPLLCQRLIDCDYTVLVETNGTQDISLLPEACIRIMDVKCPGSGKSAFFLTENINNLRPEDECKMVLSGREDFLWAIDIIHTYELHKKCPVIFSPNIEKVKPKELAEWILEANAPVRLGLQLHKIIWGVDANGV